MPKFYRRKFYKSGSTDKYSIEQQSCQYSIGANGQQAYPVVAATTIQGMRKIKHLTVSLACHTASVSGVYWALVYVPAGTSPNPLQLGTTAPTDLYEPNQFVINCGVMDFDAGPARITTPLSRNLNSGDAIYLILANASGTAIVVQSVTRYAITLQ